MGGFSGRNPFNDDFVKDVRAARKKAGAEVGKKMVAERIRHLKEENAKRIGGGVRRNSTRNAYRNSINKGGKISPRRKRHVKAKVVGKQGTLVLMDTAPIAVAQEYGQTRRAKAGKFLFITDKRRRPRDGEKVFITPGGAVMAVKPWRKWRGKGVKPENNDNRHPRLVGVLRKSITIKAIPKVSVVR